MTSSLSRCVDPPLPKEPKYCLKCAGRLCTTFYNTSHFRRTDSLSCWMQYPRSPGRNLSTFRVNCLCVQTAYVVSRLFRSSIRFPPYRSAPHRNLQNISVTTVKVSYLPLLDIIALTMHVYIDCRCNNNNNRVKGRVAHNRNSMTCRHI